MVLGSVPREQGVEVAVPVQVQDLARRRRRCCSWSPGVSRVPRRRRMARCTR
uniref:Uncharacterized protein n=1 Tax=Arundo donax TaxID=35708 RepID=A0A0A9FPK7_ARUDO